MDKLIKRSEQKVEYTWDTTHIYPSDEAWLAAFDEVAAALTISPPCGRLSRHRLYDFLTLSKSFGESHESCHAMLKTTRTGQLRICRYYGRAVSLPQ